jgi:hypothetical protein
MEAAMTDKRGERQKDLENPETLGEEGALPGGRSGGRSAREVGSKDEMKRAFERPAGVTRLRKSEKEPEPPQHKTGRQ